MKLGYLLGRLAFNNYRSMSYFHLPNSNPTEWSQIQYELSQANFTSLDHVKSLISKFKRNTDDSCSFTSQESDHFASLDYLAKNIFTDERNLVSILEKVAKNASKLDETFPGGKLPRLTRQNPKLDLNRMQALCVLSNMLVCTVKKSVHNPYWVTFSNWLGDGRTCALVYLRTLIEFFRQSFELDDDDRSRRQVISFERRQLDKSQLDVFLNSDSSKFTRLSFEMNGLIGDKSQIQVDFANMDIGFGVTGTQEEILFGKHPELCVAMLFADTMQDDEAIVISNCQKAAIYEGNFLGVVKLVVKIF